MADEVGSKRQHDRGPSQLHLGSNRKRAETEVHNLNAGFIQRSASKLDRLGVAGLLAGRDRNVPDRCQCILPVVCHQPGAVLYRHYGFITLDLFSSPSLTVKRYYLELYQVLKPQVQVQVLSLQVRVHVQVPTSQVQVQVQVLRYKVQVRVQVHRFHCRYWSLQL